MAVSKRTRFEVLRRDNYTCRYCRSTENGLTLDHVNPVALGGTDKPDNLVACCRDCNAGKSSTTPGDSLVANVSDDAIRWANARREAARMFDEDRKERRDRVASLSECWIEWDSRLEYLPVDWEEKANQWLDAGLTIGRVLDAYTIALGRPNVPARSVFAYMCGVIRNWLEKIDADAQGLLNDEDDEPVMNADDMLVMFIDRKYEAA